MVCEVVVGRIWAFKVGGGVGVAMSGVALQDEALGSAHIQDESLLAYQ